MGSKGRMVASMRSNEHMYTEHTIHTYCANIRICLILGTRSAHSGWGEFARTGWALFHQHFVSGSMWGAHLGHWSNWPTSCSSPCYRVGRCSGFATTCKVHGGTSVGPLLHCRWVCHIVVGFSMSAVGVVSCCWACRVVAVFDDLLVSSPCQRFVMFSAPSLVRFPEPLWVCHVITGIPYRLWGLCGPRGV